MAIMFSPFSLRDINDGAARGFGIGLIETKGVNVGSGEMIERKLAELIGTDFGHKMDARTRTASGHRLIGAFTARPQRAA